MRTDPRDVARVESKTFICTKNKGDAIPTAKEGVQGKLGNWTSIEEMEKTLGEQFPGCMKGRVLHVHIHPGGGTPRTYPNQFVYKYLSSPYFVEIYGVWL